MKATSLKLKATQPTTSETKPSQTTCESKSKDTSPITATEFPILIGLRGLAGAGKTTLANALVLHDSLQAYKPVRLSLATPIKNWLAAMHIAKIGDPEFYRKLAQTLGDAFRERDEEYFVDKLLEEAAEAYKRGTRLAFIDDVRYYNEGRVCDQLFFIQPDGFEATPLPTPLATHSSERWNGWFLTAAFKSGIDSETILVKNTKDELDKPLQQILASLLKPEPARPRRRGSRKP